jgi:small subunit ribosomal protein S18
MAQMQGNSKMKGKRKFVKYPVKPMYATCPFGRDTSKIDYKDIELLSKFISPRGRIMPRTHTGVSAKAQRKLAASIKRARMIALLPFVDYK